MIPQLVCWLALCSVCNFNFCTNLSDLKMKELSSLSFIECTALSPLSMYVTLEYLLRYNFLLGVVARRRVILVRSTAKSSCFSLPT